MVFDVGWVGAKLVLFNTFSSWDNKREQNFYDFIHFVSEKGIDQSGTC